MIHWRAASTSVPPPPKSWAGPARGTTTSAALPVRYRVTLAWAGRARTADSSNRETVFRLIVFLLYPSQCARQQGMSPMRRLLTLWLTLLGAFWLTRAVVSALLFERVADRGGEALFLLI